MHFTPLRTPHGNTCVACVVHASVAMTTSTMPTHGGQLTARNAWTRRHTGLAMALLVLLAAVLFTSCAPGHERFTADAPAGFFFGVWHGCIAWISLILSVFMDNITVYEAHNTGGWYNLGFLLGAGMAMGGGSRGAGHGHRRVTRRRREAEDAELAALIEAKIKRRIRAWANAEPDEDWDAVEKKAEAKFRDAVRRWASEP